MDSLGSSLHKSPGKVKDWTILVYGGGVNNLDGSIRKNWEAADDQPLPDNVDVFVRHIDSDGKAFDVHMDAQGTTVGASGAEPVDSSSPQTLGDFFAEGVKKYPAKRFMAVVSSHGKGAEGVIEDARLHKMMNPQDLKAAFEVGRQANQGRPLDGVLFDACRMSAIEVSAQLVGSALVAVASMDNIAGVGYSLTEVVKAASLSGDAYELGDRLVHNKEEQQQVACMSLAAVDLQRMEPLQHSVAALARELQALDADSATTVRRVSESTRRNTASPDSWDMADQLSDHILSSDKLDPGALTAWLETTQPGQAVALVAFCQDLLAQKGLLKKYPSLEASLQAVMAAHDEAVYSARAHDRDQWPGGLTIALPLSANAGEPLYGDHGREQLDFEKSTGWSQAVFTVVPPGQPAQRKPTWVEDELRKKGIDVPASAIAAALEPHEA